MAIFLFLLFFNSLAFGQESLSCDSRGAVPYCQSSTGFAQTQVPDNQNNQVLKLFLPKDSGQDISLLTIPGSNPIRYFLQVENPDTVSLNLKLQSQATSDLVIEKVKDASSLVLMAGKVSSLNLDVSGYKGKDGQNFSKACALDIAQGKFGDDSLNHFLSTRALDPNLPKDQCQAPDIKNIALNQKDIPQNTYCPDGSFDLGQDDNLNPTFQITRLKEEPYCRLQKDIRSCQTLGNRYFCGMQYVYQNSCASGVFSGFCSNSYPPNATIYFKGQALTPYNNPTYSSWNYCSKWTLGVCSERTYVDRWIYDWKLPDTEFYVAGTPSADDNANYCGNFSVSWNGVTRDLNTWTALNTYSYLPALDKSINDTYSTTNQLCDSNAYLVKPTESPYFYVHPERGVTNITAELSIDYQRFYSYYQDVCPAGWELERLSQDHNNLFWSETLTCDKDTCPKIVYSFDETERFKTDITLNSSQSGADKGKAALFVYDLLESRFKQTPGQNGLLSQMDLEQPSTIKNCVSIQDLKNAQSVSDVQGKTPIVVLHRVYYKPYHVLLPQPGTKPVFNTDNSVQLYKKMDSSARNWIFNSIGGP